MRTQPIKGFVDYGVDIVLKFGGSLTRDLERCQALIGAIAGLAAEGQRILILPGGGRTDKVIEAIDRERPLAAETAHRACALAQDQTGLILADPAFSDRLVACETLAACRAALAQGNVAVLLPSRLLFDVDPVEQTFEITSDAVGVWLAWLTGARRVAILTDVDGVFEAGRIGDPDHLIATISAAELLRMGHTSIDACAVAFLQARGMDCTVLNGLHPDRVAAWGRGQDATGTAIIGAATTAGGARRAAA